MFPHTTNDHHSQSSDTPTNTNVPKSFAGMAPPSSSYNSEQSSAVTSAKPSVQWTAGSFQAVTAAPR